MYVNNIYLLLILLVINIIIGCKAAEVAITTKKLNSKLNIITFKNSKNIIYYENLDNVTKFYISYDNGITWDEISDIKENNEILDIIQHPLDDNNLYIITTNIIYQTKDAGKFWKENIFDLKLQKDSLKFNLNNENEIMFVGEDCIEDLCSTDLYITKDMFMSSEKILASTEKCVFSNIPKENSIFCIQSIENESRQIVRSTDYFETYDKIFLSGESIDIFSDNYKIIAISESKVEKGKNDVWISNDGNSFTKSLYSSLNKDEIFNQKYNFIRNSEKIFSVIVEYEYEYNNDMEEIEIRKNQTYYSLSSDGSYLIEKFNIIKNENDSKGIECKVLTNQGTVICNIIENGVNVTKYSMNNGMNWENVKMKNSEKEQILNIDISSIIKAETNNVSSGKIICNGNINNEKKMSTLISHNGGLAWEIIRDEPSMGVILNHGSLIVLSSLKSENHHMNEIEPNHSKYSNNLIFSIDNGIQWNTMELGSKNIGKHFKINSIYECVSDYNEEQSLIIIGRNKKNEIIINVKINIEEESCSDENIEVVNLFNENSKDDVCVNGIKTKILRRKMEDTCIIRIEKATIISKFEKTPIEICKCKIDDYECDSGFIYDEKTSKENNTLSCKPINELIYQPIECNDTYMAPSGIRKIPGNVCDNKNDNDDGDSENNESILQKKIKFNDSVEKKCKPRSFEDANSQLWGSSTPTSSSYTFDREIQKFLYFRKSDIILLITMNGSSYISVDGGTKWERIFDDYTVFGMILHDVDDKRAYFIFSNNEIWMTDDCLQEYLSKGKKPGKHFFKIDTPENQSYNRLGISIIDFHPTEPEYLVFTGEGGRNCPGIGCYTQAYYTRNNGKDWEFLDKNVGKCLFALDVEFTIEVPKDAVYCLTHDPDERDLMKLILYEPNGKKIEKTIIKENVVNYFVVSKYLVMAVEESDTIKLLISLDGKTFAEAKYPPSVEIKMNTFTVLESTTGRLFINVNNDPGNFRKSSYGTLYISNSNGTYYNESVEKTNISRQGIVDFEKIQGLEGIILVNEITAKNKARTVISFNDGSSWSSIPRPTDLNNEKVPCSKDDCRLNLHSHSAIENSVSVGYLYSSPFATGILLGIGNVGPYLSDINNADTYMSIDAGLTWKLIRKGIHSWEFIDQGSIIVLIQEDTPTNVLYYSTNYGKDWNEYQFLNSEKIYLRTLTSDPESKSMYAFILGYKQGEAGKIVSVSVNFEKILKKQCTKSDFEDWKLSTNGRNSCLLGHETTYQRRKKDSQCYVGDYEKKIEKVNCQCSEIDYECDFSYWKDIYGKCILNGIDPKQPKDCKDGTSYEGNSGYRKIAASTCTGKFDKLEDPVKRICGKEDDSSSSIKRIEHMIDSVSEWFYFEESETLMYINQYHELYISYNEGKEWEQVERDEKFSSFILPRENKNMAIFLTFSKKHFYTVDKGKTFSYFDTPTLQNELKIQPLTVNPVNPGWWLFTGSDGCKSGSFVNNSECHTILYYTKNYGKTWEEIETYVRHCEWGITEKFDYLSPSSIYCQTYREKKGSMLQPMGNNSLELKYSDNFFKNSKELISGVMAFAIFDKYMMVAQISGTARDEAKLYTTTDGLTFSQAKFPPNFKIPDVGFTILESTTGKIFLDVFVRQTLSSEHGLLFMSNSNGTLFSPSLENTNRNSFGYVDFEKMIGIPGIAMANIVSNPDDYEKTKKVQTKISFNDGASWEYIKAPSKDVFGKSYNCDSEIDENCNVHFHSYTERREPRNFFSSETAVGMMVGIGNVGESLEKYKDSDTFLTRDAGKTWVEIHKDAHLYEFGDYGGILLLVNDEVATNFLEFSIDQGHTFTKYQFVESKDRKVRVKDILTVPDATSLKFIILGTINDSTNDSGKEIMIYLDFSEIKSNKCVIDHDDPEKSDFELWSPSISENGCLLGQKIEYYRRKEGNDCYMDEKFKDPEFKSSLCTCTEFDYECDFNYLRNNNTCELISGAEIPVSDCFKGKYYESTGYRKIPLSKCIDGVRLDVDGAKSHWCAGGANGSWSTSTKLLIVGFPVIGVILFVYYHKSQSWREGTIRLPTNESLNPTMNIDLRAIGETLGNVANNVVDAIVNAYYNIRNYFIHRNEYAPLSLNDP